MSAIVVLICLSVPTQADPTSSAETNFYEGITSAALEHYLSRAVQCAGTFADSGGDESTHLSDDVRMLQNVGARFVGRAALTWGMSTDDDKHFEQARKSAELAHKAKPDIILQACVFEIVHTSSISKKGRQLPGVDTTTVPAWVFEEFDLPVEKRCFNYVSMISKDGQGHNLWSKDASVPDITRLEARMWFYYRARRYIDAGYEAIHFGQAGMIGMNDTDRSAWADVLARVRTYASKVARRRYVLCDSHLVMTDKNVPLSYNGKLLWDFASFPLRLAETTEPLKAQLRAGRLDSMYGRMPGGVHPAGWLCDELPQLYEFDNCTAGISAENPGATLWGADEATWFANQPEAYRNEFLQYTWHWIWTNTRRGYLQMPGRRPAHIPVLEPRIKEYVINTRGKGCPNGGNQEETVKALWNDSQYRDASLRTAMKPVSAGEPPTGVIVHSLAELRRLYQLHGMPAEERAIYQ